MTTFRVSEFPALRRALSGYLHEDFLAEHETPEAALRAFYDEATPAERRRLVGDVKKFLERTDALDFSELQTLLHRLGCRWAAPSREALVALLQDVAQPADSQR